MARQSVNALYALTWFLRFRVKFLGGITWECWWPGIFRLLMALSHVQSLCRCFTISFARSVLSMSCTWISCSFRLLFVDGLKSYEARHSQQSLGIWMITWNLICALPLLEFLIIPISYLEYLLSCPRMSLPCIRFRVCPALQKSSCKCGHRDIAAHLQQHAWRICLDYEQWHLKWRSLGSLFWYSKYLLCVM